MKVIRHALSRQARGRGLVLRYGFHDFPAGRLLLALSGEGLCWLGIGCGLARLRREWKGAALVEDAAATAAVARDIRRRWPRGLNGLAAPVVLYGTPFQLRVWRALLKIRPGATLTYAELARKIGQPRAARAVGSAVGRNPVSIVVPCHRVVSRDARRVSYGWGPAVKKMLLQGEQAR